MSAIHPLSFPSGAAVTLSRNTLDAVARASPAAPGSKSTSRRHPNHAPDTDATVARAACRSIRARRPCGGRPPRGHGPRAGMDASAGAVSPTLIRGAAGARNGCEGRRARSASPRSAGGAVTSASASSILGRCGVAGGHAGAAAGAPPSAAANASSSSRLGARSAKSAATRDDSESDPSRPRRHPRGYRRGRTPRETFARASVGGFSARSRARSRRLLSTHAPYARHAARNAASRGDTRGDTRGGDRGAAGVG